MLVGCIIARLPRSKRRHLDGFGAGKHINKTKTPADDESAPEKRLDLFGRRGGGKVEVFRCDAEQEVAYRAAADKCREAGLLQLADDILRAARDLRAPNRMRVGAVDARFGCDLAGHEPCKKTTNHRSYEVAKRLIA